MDNSQHTPPRGFSAERIGLRAINGPLVVVDGLPGTGYEEVVTLTLDDGTTRQGRVIELEGTKAVVQVFEGTQGLSRTNTRTAFSGKPMRVALAKELFGRVLDGCGRPADGLGELFPETYGDINGMPINPISRVYPREVIQTGISAIDTLTTLIRGQKLPVFSGSGMQHNALAVQIVRNARLLGRESNFGIVFAAMGVKHDVAAYFRAAFEHSGAMRNVVMVQNLSSDPVIERIITPRVALTIAEYMAFTHHMHMLVVMTDMTAYAEALRELSSSKGEFPGRKGYPGYLYSDLASLYERAGILQGVEGSVTQLPILTMPNDDITHPVPDLTAYITEGQIVLDRALDKAGVYPPVSMLSSLSRLMKDGIGEGYTRKDHAAVSAQLFACCARVQDARALASVIGEEELSDIDKQYIAFGRQLEAKFLNQRPDEDRGLLDSLDLGWSVLSLLPRELLDRVDDATLGEFYRPQVTEEA